MSSSELTPAQQRQAQLARLKGGLETQCNAISIANQADVCLSRSRDQQRTNSNKQQRRQRQLEKPHPTLFIRLQPSQLHPVTPPQAKQQQLTFPMHRFPVTRGWESTLNMI